MAKRYKGSFTIREADDKPRRGRKKSNSRVFAVLLLILFIAWLCTAGRIGLRPICRNAQISRDEHV